MDLLEKFRQVRVFAFDIDGVLTDGTVYVMDSGEQVRRMSIKDGFALQLAIKKGYQVVVISGSFSQPVADRLAKLGVTDTFMRVHNKLECLLQFLSPRGLSLDQVLFMGDDIPDLELMDHCGLPACPADAVGEIRKASLYISRFNGGEGCVRDVIEKVLKLNNHWELYTNIPSR